jgi:hypothetical protein
MRMNKRPGIAPGLFQFKNACVLAADADALIDPMMSDMDAMSLDGAMAVMGGGERGRPTEKRKRHGSNHNRLQHENLPLSLARQRLAMLAVAISNDVKFF